MKLKLFIMPTLLLSFTVGLTAGIDQDEADLTSSMLSSALDKIDKTPLKQAKSAVADLLCGKGKLLKGELSLRSGSGMLCSFKLPGAFAEVLCGGDDEDKHDKYLKSGCHKNALKALGDEDPKDVIASSIAKFGGPLKAKVCSLMSSMPLISNVCEYKSDEDEEEMTEIDDDEEPDVENTADEEEEAVLEE